jgi:hypothetical protein
LFVEDASGLWVPAFAGTTTIQALFASFGVAMLIGVLCIYGVLVLLFADFMQPVTILAALPLSIGGVFVALLITNSALSMPTMIGLIMLMGIVTKNSILLVDYAILARHAGMSRFDALVDACHKRSRPIVMTTVAMGAGMLPLALGWSGDSSFRSSDGNCRNRRADDLHPAQPACSARGVHLRGRPVAVPQARHGPATAALTPGASAHQKGRAKFDGITQQRMDSAPKHSSLPRRR